MQPKQPKISQKLLVRSAIGLFALAALAFGYRYYKSIESDPFGNVKVGTVGMVAAVQIQGESKHVVIIKSDGSLLTQPAAPEGTEDRDPAWRPDGNAVFFASNRKDERFTMFRWAPEESRVPEQRAVGNRAQGAPFFLAADSGLGGDARALITSGGAVMEYDPKQPATRQLLPPVNAADRATVDDGEGAGGGSASPFEAQYSRFGTSFKKAQWTPDKNAVFAVMRREGGEILIYQKLNVKDLQEGLPQPIVAGDRVEFDVDETTGVVFYSVQNFQWWDPAIAPPEFRKGNRLTTPFRHGVGAFDPAGTRSGAISTNKDDKAAFGQIAVNPQGGSMLVTFGPYLGDGNIKPAGMMLFKLGPQGGIERVTEGEVYEPAWSPEGSKFVFAMRESATSRPLFVQELGGTARRLTTGDGVFSQPVFSPQKG